MVAVIDEKIVRGHTLIILYTCHQGNHYILTPRKYYLQYKQKYGRLNRFGRLFVKVGLLPFLVIYFLSGNAPISHIQLYGCRNY